MSLRLPAALNHEHRTLHCRSGVHFFFAHNSIHSARCGDLMRKSSLSLLLSAARVLHVSSLRPGIAQWPALLFFLAFVFPIMSVAQSTSQRRPMTFDDMMQMKRLGDTAVSPDGKWLAYSVTTVNLAANTKTPELWLQAIAGPSAEGPAPMKLA